MSLPALQAFCKIVELCSFRQAADALNVPLATVSNQVKSLEARLGTRLLDRSSRRIAPTPEGQAYYRRIAALIEGLHEAEQLLKHSDTLPRGHLHVSVPASVARLVLAPALPQLLARYPELRLRVMATDQLVDLAQQGLDCAVRAGSASVPGEAGATSVRMPQYFAASPALVARLGEPQSLTQLAAFPFINYAGERDSDRISLRVHAGREVQQIQASAVVSVDDGSAYVAMACAGLGVIHSPLYDLRPEVNAGRLTILLPQWQAGAITFHVVYANGRRHLPRVKVFVAWVQQLLEQPALHQL